MVDASSRASLPPPTSWPPTAPGPRHSKPLLQPGPPIAPRLSAEQAWAQKNHGRARRPHRRNGRSRRWPPAVPLIATLLVVFALFNLGHFDHGHSCATWTAAASPVRDATVPLAGPPVRVALAAASGASARLWRRADRDNHGPPSPAGLNGSNTDARCRKDCGQAKGNGVCVLDAHDKPICDCSPARNQSKNPLLPANEDCSKVGIDAFDPALFFTSVIFTVTLFLAALVPVFHSLWRRWTHRDADRVRSTSWLHLIVMLLFIPACLPRALSFILDPFAGRQTLISSQVSRVLFMSYFTIVLSQYSVFLILWFEFTAHIRVMVPHLLSPDRRLRAPPDISALVKTIRLVFAAVNVALYGFEVAMVLLGATTMLQSKYMTPIYAGFFVVMSVALVVGLVFASYRLNVGRHHRHNLSEMHPDPDVARLVAVQAAATRRAVYVSAFIVLNTFLRMVVVFDVLRDPNVWLGYQDFLRLMEVTSGLVLWQALTSIQWNALEPVYADLNATAIRASPASSPTTRHRTPSQERRTAALRALGLPRLFTSAALASSSANDSPRRRRSAFTLCRTPLTPPATPTAAPPATPARTDPAHAAGIVFVNDRRRPGLYIDRQPSASTFELNFKMIHGHSIGSTPVDHVELEDVASKPVAPAAAAPDAPRWPDPDDPYWRGATGASRQDLRGRGAKAGEPRPPARAARVVSARPPDVDHDWDDEWSVIDNGRAPVAW